MFIRQEKKINLVNMKGYNEALKKYDYTPEADEFKCLKYGSKLECKTCDGFGRNSDNNIDTENCYNTKRNITNILELLYRIKDSKK